LFCGELGQVLGEHEGRVSADVVAEQAVELGFERGVLAGFGVFVGELLDSGVEGFGDVAAAEGTRSLIY
jgi:hypothetical protein